MTTAKEALKEAGYNLTDDAKTRRAAFTKAAESLGPGKWAQIRDELRSRQDALVANPYTNRGIQQRLHNDRIQAQNMAFREARQEKQRERLYREIDRFYADDRFDQFIVMVEGSYKEFLRYVPLADRMSTTGYWLKVESMLNSKKSTINSLNVRPGAKVIFCDSREDMVERFRDMIRQWVIHNFEEVLK